MMISRISMTLFIYVSLFQISYLSAFPLINHSYYQLPSNHSQSVPRQLRSHSTFLPDNKLNDNVDIEHQHHSASHFVSQASSINTASTFTLNAQISTSQQLHGGFSLYYLDRISIDCSGLGLNFFGMVNPASSSYWYYNLKCATPGFTATATYSYSNLQPAQGGTVPIVNMKFLQYLTPYIADCRYLSIHVFD
jgi:hypothetical protein